MKRILRIKVEGLPLYKTPFDVSFCATQRVEKKHLNMVYKLTNNIYINTTEAFIGINASGKTTALNIISFTSAMLAAKPLNGKFIPQILGDNIKTTFDVDFFENDKIYHLNSVIIKSKEIDGDSKISILSEKLWVKSVTSKVTKANMLDFSGKDPVRIRDNSDEYLSDDVSIIIAVNKQFRRTEFFVDLVGFTNYNLFMKKGGNVPKEIISLLDPTIEYINVENVNDKFLIHLKFFEQKEMVLHSRTELNAYLSSGTVKGVRVFIDAVLVLKNGGYLLVDEVENHFNRELVVSLLRLFMDKRTNPKGAVIIFSTHYPELLDEIERNDAVFITRSSRGLTVDNLNSLLKRNDMKKSEVYQSNFLGGTAPEYKSLIALQKSIIKELEE